MKQIYRLNWLIKKRGIYPKFLAFETAGTEPISSIRGKDYIIFCSNNYLGLAKHPNVIKAAQTRLRAHGTGPGGSRLLCGNIQVLTLLDQRLASLVGKEDAISFPTGYMANSAIFQALTDPMMYNMPHKKGTGVIISDEKNHTSLIEGMRLSHARKEIYKHNDLLSLENKLKECHASKGFKLIVTEGVFSMEGEIAPLPEIVLLAKKYKYKLMVDDAHGLGVLGEHGGGTSELFGLQKNIDIVMGSLDKAIGAMGGFLAGDKDLISYLRIASKPYIFSSAVPAVLAGGAIAAIDIIQNHKELRRRVIGTGNYLRSRLKNIGYDYYGEDELPVVSIKIGPEKKGLKVEQSLLENGIMAPLIRWPAVEKGKSRIRVTLMATHNKSHIDHFLSVLKKL